MNLTSKKKNQKEQNLLTMTPVLKDRFALDHEQDDSAAHLVVPRSNFVERMSVRFFNQPDSIKVRLDSLGNYVLSHCDGTTTVSDIADGLEEEFGEDAKPILPRLVKFLQMVEANDWIFWKPEH